MQSERAASANDEAGWVVGGGRQTDIDHSKAAYDWPVRTDAHELVVVALRAATRPERRKTEHIQRQYAAAGDNLSTAQERDSCRRVSDDVPA